jgi:hypothetical protein
LHSFVLPGSHIQAVNLPPWAQPPPAGYNYVRCTLQGNLRNRNIFYCPKRALGDLFGLFTTRFGCYNQPKVPSPQVGCPVLMSEEKKSRWKVPLGIVATGVAGVTVLLLRGCWHRKMSWPVRAQGHTYQVCLGCGIKRLFDERCFRAYGPFSYELNRLIAWDDRQAEKVSPQRRPA